MPIDPTAAADADALNPDILNAYFPKQRPKLGGDNTFEIGLALAGTVSAGAYTAGVLDYLVEVLDAWEAAKAANDPADPVPSHGVVISTLAGSSGGGINGAVFLASLRYAFPHGPTAENPFYETWVNGPTLKDFLEPGPGKDGAGPMAALNTTPLVDKVAAILAMRGPGARPPRRWLADPVNLIMTVGNLSGVPYTMKLPGTGIGGLGMVDHAAEFRFALPAPGGIVRTLPDSVSGHVWPARPDVVTLSSDPHDSGWAALGRAALATSAFPIAFDARVIERTYADLSLKAVLVPGDDSSDDPRNRFDQVVQLEPDRAALAALQIDDGPTYKMLFVDGGTVDNEPIGLARREISGLAYRSPRDGNKAYRAVVLIDPFASKPQPTPAPTNLPALAGALVKQFVQNARYRPEDIALAQSEAAFSRFLIAPTTPGLAKGEPLATGELNGFGGFLDRDLLEHDFLLGRYNAFLFLTGPFRFPSDNNVIAQGYAGDPALTEVYRSGIYTPECEVDGNVHLPMIPLTKRLREAPPPYPGPAPDLSRLPAVYTDEIATRLNYLFDTVRTPTPPKRPGLWAGVFYLAWCWKLGAMARDWVIGKINAGLKPDK